MTVDDDKLREWEDLTHQSHSYPSPVLQRSICDMLSTIRELRAHLSTSRELASALMRERDELREKLSAVDARAAELADDETATQRVVRSADTLVGDDDG